MTMSDAGTLAPLDGFQGGWIEEKIARRRESVRMTLLRELHGRHKEQRARRRLIAKVALLAAVMILSFTFVEIVRRAHHIVADSAERQEFPLAYRR